MDGAGGPTSDAVAAPTTPSSASAPRLEAYRREEIEALVAEVLRTRAALREELDDARHEALARQTPQPLEVVPRTDADDALRLLEGELTQLRTQLAEAQAHLATTPAAPPIPVVVPLEGTPAATTGSAPAPPGADPVTWTAPPPVHGAPPFGDLPVELQPTGPVPVVPVAPIVERVVVERPFSRTTGLLQVVVWSVIVAVVLIVLLAWFA
jgi:hypothetical protein